MPNPIKLGRTQRMTFSKINEVAEMPNLIQIQTDSYKWFVEEGLREVFEDVSPIKEYSDNLVLEFIDYSLSDPPKYEQEVVVAWLAVTDDLTVTWIVKGIRTCIDSA